MGSTSGSTTRVISSSHSATCVKDARRGLLDAEAPENNETDCQFNVCEAINANHIERPTDPETIPAEITEDGPPRKRRKVSSESQSVPVPSEPPLKGFPDLDRWPDDILLLLLEVVDYDTLKALRLTCTRLDSLLRHHECSIAESRLAAIPYLKDIENLVESRNEALKKSPLPDRHSFSYLKLIHSVYSDLQTVATEGNRANNSPCDPLPFCFYRGMMLPYANPLRPIRPERYFPHEDHPYSSNHLVSFDCFLHPIRLASIFWIAFWKWKKFRLHAEWIKGLIKPLQGYRVNDVLGAATLNVHCFQRLFAMTSQFENDARDLLMEFAKNSANIGTWSVQNEVTYYTITHEKSAQYGLSRVKTSITIPTTATVSEWMSPTLSKMTHTIMSQLTPLDRAIYRLADLDGVSKATGTAIDSLILCMRDDKVLQLGAFGIAVEYLGMAALLEIWEQRGLNMEEFLVGVHQGLERHNPSDHNN